MEFKMANRLYVQSGFSLEAEFKSALVKFFGASAEIVDFMDRRNTVGLINEWVAEQTNGKIKKLVKQSNKFFHDNCHNVSNGTFCLFQATLGRTVALWCSTLSTSAARGYTHSKRAIPPSVTFSKPRRRKSSCNLFISASASCTPKWTTSTRSWCRFLIR